MSEKHLVCHGALCKCNFGTLPDKLSVNTHQKEYINDSKGAQKRIATDKDIAKTFEKNTFGTCAKLNNAPCQVIVTEWKGFYEKTTLNNGGKPLLEDSTATCPIGAPGCISIVFHGQVAQVSNANVDNAKPETMTALNPLVGKEALTEDNTPDYY
ncbi:DUF4280 domain-containing protein [Flavobacterium sp.]|uniref:DUF4280 domain-containing protein n=1 Tax=Flavobacterium sp. TaxID=239 RepID=UPI001224E4C9|nr:DUF4280 domain-containing protein [Flavobacterium sp.]RZJ70726.1 MAG: DUF4280 domain-containing protein [Flavobacterium sp.]